MPPRLGDVILDAAGGRWTVLEVKRATLGARWCCSSRDVAIAFGLDDTISVLKATDSRGGCGAAGPCGERGGPASGPASSRPRPQIAHAAGVASTTTQLSHLRRGRPGAGPHLLHSRRGRDDLHHHRPIGAERIGELQVIDVERDLVEQRAVAGPHRGLSRFSRRGECCGVNWLGRRENGTVPCMREGTGPCFRPIVYPETRPSRRKMDQSPLSCTSSSVATPV